MNRQERERIGEAYERGEARLQAAMAKHGVGRAEAAQIVQRQTAQQKAVNEVRDYARQLGPQHVAYLQQLEATGGPDMVIGALTGAGLSREALDVVSAAFQYTGSLAGVAQLVQEDIAAAVQQEQAATLEASVARHAPSDQDTPEQAQIKRMSPLARNGANPEVQKLFAAYLQKIGMEVKPGQTAYDAMLPLLRDLEDGSFMNADRIPGAKSDPRSKKWTREETIAAMAELWGETPKAVSELLSELDVQDATHEFASRLAARDNRQPRIKMDPEATRRTRSEESRRSDLSAAYDRFAGEEEKAPEVVKVEIGEPPEGLSPAGENVWSRGEALSAAYDKLDAQGEA